MSKKRYRRNQPPDQPKLPLPRFPAPSAGLYDHSIGIGPNSRGERERLAARAAEIATETRRQELEAQADRSPPITSA